MARIWRRNANSDYARRNASLSSRRRSKRMDSRGKLSTIDHVSPLPKDPFPPLISTSDDAVPCPVPHASFSKIESDGDDAVVHVHLRCFPVSRPIAQSPRSPRENFHWTGGYVVCMMIWRDLHWWNILMLKEGILKSSEINGHLFFVFCNCVITRGLYFLKFVLKQETHLLWSAAEAQK